jgi:hypothetical protein
MDDTELDARSRRPRGRSEPPAVRQDAARAAGPPRAATERRRREADAR